VFGAAFQSMTQSPLESIDCFPDGEAFDLRADQPAVDVEVGLRDHSAGHRWIAVLTQSDTSVQHRLVGEATELADLFPCVVLGTGYLPMRRYLDVENRG
jgi:hypothetical protein